MGGQRDTTVSTRINSSSHPAVGDFQQYNAVQGNQLAAVASPSHSPSLHVPDLRRSTPYWSFDSTQLLPPPLTLAHCASSGHLHDGTAFMCTFIPPVVRSDVKVDQIRFAVYWRNGGRSRIVTLVVHRTSFASACRHEWCRTSPPRGECSAERGGNTHNDGAAPAKRELEATCSIPRN
jgi:hypothetical protein